MARPGGKSRGRSAGEPPPAARPIMASGWPKVALSEAMMKSVLWASSEPPPHAAPLRREDRFSQLADGVEGAVKVLLFAASPAWSWPYAAGDRCRRKRLGCRRR